MRLSGCRLAKLFVINAVMAISGISAQPAPPVLVELFTSEGCSSCPPADLLLQKIERTQFVPGVSIIALSEHVDYWNHLGWSDPYSSAQITARQEAYAARFRSRGAYTPQMVVDGAVEFLGSDPSLARRAIATAFRRPKLELTAEMISPGTLHLTAPVSATPADLFMAIVHDPEPSSVVRGENKGRLMPHVSVVKSLKKVGIVGPNKAFDEGLAVTEDAKLHNQRVVAFVQERSQGRILGSVEVSVRQSAGIVARWSPQK